jgi:hypothetical protein
MSYINQLREHPLVQETGDIAYQAWTAATTTAPLIGAIAGLAIMFIFGVILPLLLHIFFGDVAGPVGRMLGGLSDVLGTALRVFGFFGGLICWGAAVRNFAEQHRA